MYYFFYIRELNLIRKITLSKIKASLLWLKGQAYVTFMIFFLILPFCPKNMNINLNESSFGISALTGIWWSHGRVKQESSRRAASARRASVSPFYRSAPHFKENQCIF